MLLAVPSSGLRAKRPGFDADAPNPEFPVVDAEGPNAEGISLPEATELLFGRGIPAPVVYGVNPVGTKPGGGPALTPSANGRGVVRPLLGEGGMIPEPPKVPVDAEGPKSPPPDEAVFIPP